MDRALEELRQGKKRGCYLWNVFPLLRALGKSRKSEVFGLRGVCEARAYLLHPTLGVRFAKCCETLLLHRDKKIEEIFSPCDVAKLCASMTLFEAADEHFTLASEVLDTFFAGRRDPLTLYLLNLEKQGETL